jgi:hypothetical protein
MSTAARAAATPPLPWRQQAATSASHDAAYAPSSFSLPRDVARASPLPCTVLWVRLQLLVEEKMIVDKK